MYFLNHIAVLLVSLFSLVSCNANQPKIVNELLFGNSFEELTKKFGAFETDDRVTCKTPPKCDFYYGQQTMENNCLWRGMNAMADHQTGKLRWVSLSIAGKCNGIADNAPVGKFFSKDDPSPDFNYFDSARGQAFANWEKGGIYVSVWADCYDPTTRKTEDKLLNCKLLNVSIRDEDKTKQEFKKNNFKFF